MNDFFRLSVKFTVGTESRLVRTDKAGSSPPSDFSFSAGFLFIEKKKCKRNSEPLKTNQLTVHPAADTSLT